MFHGRSLLICLLVTDAQRLWSCGFVLTLGRDIAVRLEQAPIRLITDPVARLVLDSVVCLSQL